MISHNLLPASPEFLVLADLFATGHPVRLEDGRLMVRNAETLTDGQRAALKERRAAIIELMTPAWLPEPAVQQGTLPFDTQQKGQ